MVSINKQLGKDFAVEVSNIKIGSDVGESDIIHTVQDTRQVGHSSQAFCFRDEN